MPRLPFAPALRRRITEARILGIPGARVALAVSGMALGIAFLAGAIRVLPVLLAPDVPIALALPLARGIALVGLEIALFVAPPIAWAFSASRLVERGDVRALAAIGVRPLRIALGAAPAAAVFALAAAAASFAWGRDAAAPGRIASELLETARSACISAPAPAAVDVPLLGFSWICLPNEAPRVVGIAPVGAAPAYFTAESIALTEDLRALRVSGLEMLVPAPGEERPTREAHVSVASATIAGLTPFTRGSNLSPFARGGFLGATTFLLAALAAIVVMARSTTSPAAAIALGILGPACAIAVFSALERAPAPPALYALVPLAGIIALGACARLPTA